jgi:hypothetical protein
MKVNLLVLLSFCLIFNVVKSQGTTPYAKWELEAGVAILFEDKRPLAGAYNINVGQVGDAFGNTFFMSYEHRSRFFLRAGSVLGRAINSTASEEFRQSSRLAQIQLGYSLYLPKYLDRLRFALGYQFRISEYTLVYTSKPGGVAMPNALFSEYTDSYLLASLKYDAAVPVGEKYKNLFFLPARVGISLDFARSIDNPQWSGLSRLSLPSGLSLTHYQLILGFGIIWSL